MANIKNITLDKIGYLKVDLTDIIEIDSTQKVHVGQTEPIDCLYIKQPTKSDMVHLEKINNSLIIANKALAKFGLEIAAMASKMDEQPKNEKEPTEQEAIFARLNTMSHAIPDEFQKVLASTWNYIKNKIYTTSGIADSANYNNVNISYLEDEQFALTVQLQQQSTIQYLVFFTNFFAGLSSPRKF